MAFLASYFGASAQSISSNLNNRPNVHTGVEEAFTVALNAGASLGTSVKLKITLANPAQAPNINLSLADPISGNYNALIFDGAGVSESDAAPFFNVTLNAKVTFTAAGVYNYSVSVINASTNAVLANSDETVTVTDVLAAPTISSSLNGRSIFTGDLTTYGVSSTPGGYAGTNVKVRFKAMDLSQVGHYDIEYFETSNASWMALPLNGAGEIDFGPTAGFPLAAATTQFRVTFDATGTYTYKLSLYRVSDNQVLATADESVTVEDREAPTVSSDLDGQTVIVGDLTEYEIGTTPGDYAGTHVKVLFTALDPGQVSHYDIEYFETSNASWIALPLNGAGEIDFGPAAGFPLAAATTQFRVTFDAVGTYNYKLSLYRVSDNEVLASTEESVIVEEREAPTISSDLNGQTVIVGDLTEYEIGTTPGGYAGTNVKVLFTALDPGQVSHYDIEYFETSNSSWMALPLNGAGEIDFGPAAGFPLATTSTQFRVTFDAAGTYDYKLSLYRVSDNEVLVSTEESVIVEEPVAEDPEISSTLDNRSGVRVNEDVDFRVNTTQNDAGSVNVRIRFTLVDPSRANDVNLRFQNPLTSTLESVTFDASGIGFAGAATGFALTDADYDFKTEFFAGGTYAYKLALVEAGSNNLLAESEEQVSVLDNSGITENAAAVLNVFPNPTADKLQIVTGAEGTGSLDVVSLTGQTVLTQTVNGPVNTVSLTQLPAGVYVIRIRQNGAVSQTRVVKQ